MFYYIYVKYLLHKELALHNYIRKRRKERHLSQDMLAQKANVTRQTINAIENAKECTHDNTYGVWATHHFCDIQRDREHGIICHLLYLWHRAIKIL